MSINMENTYTYTARSADRPERMLTFTLYDHSLSVGVGGPMAQIGRALPYEQGGPGMPPKGNWEQWLPWLKSMAASMIQRRSRPFSVVDVDALTQDGDLRVTVWVRALGLRLGGIRLLVRNVDNPEATRGFIKELNARKASAVPSGRFPGLLDYWLSWLLAGVLTSLLMFGGVRRIIRRRE